MHLDDDQRRVVDHDAGPLRVVGGFGSGKTVALRARAERLRSEGRRPLLLRHDELLHQAIGILRRHGREVELVRPPGLRRLVADVVADSVDVDEAVATIEGFRGSFLGDEELRVHADAAGCLPAAETVIAATAATRAGLARRGLVDAAGALVDASLLLRDPAVLEAERARFDELLIDDYQLATFATHRLVTQLAGAGGPVVVAGNADAAVSSAPLASAVHLERFDRRFGAPTLLLAGDYRRPWRPPEVRLLGDDEPTVGPSWVGEAELVVGRDDVESVVGREGRVVFVVDATDGRWPAPPSRPRWFDPELFHGPDVPDEGTRAARWRERERRRFLVATSRATEATVVFAHAPVTPFVGDLLR